jgi:hypothetical protein
VTQILIKMLNFNVIVIYYFLTFFLLNRDDNSGSFFYIDVCDRGSLKHSVFYPAIIQNKPAAAVDIFQQMMHEFNQSVNEIIRTEGNEFCKLFGRLISTSCSHIPIRRPRRCFHFEKLSIQFGSFSMRHYPSSDSLHQRIRRALFK